MDGFEISAGDVVGTALSHAEVAISVLRNAHRYGPVGKVELDRAIMHLLQAQADTVLANHMLDASRPFTYLNRW